MRALVLLVEASALQGLHRCVDKAGKTYHSDAKGKRVRMKDGVVMMGKDGSRYLHRNDVIWKQITEKGSLAPNR